MATLMQANREWMSRPADQRFTSLKDMLRHFQVVREHSAAKVVSNRRIEVKPTSDAPMAGLAIHGPNGNGYEPTHWSFGQLAALAGAPASYLRDLPAPLAADCMNYGLKYNRSIEDIGVLITVPNEATGPGYALRAATGPNYGRIHNDDITAALVSRFGNGVDGDWTVPGEFGKALEEVTKDNTTLFASDRDMFVFLANETNQIEVPNRRNGQSGSMARGFYVWNSDVGSRTFRIGTFQFDYVCCNRIVWGAEEYKEVRIRHTSSAPDRFLEQVQPALEHMAQSDTFAITDAIAKAQAAKITTDVGDWLASRFSKGMVKELQERHMLEEYRPIETLWDVTTAVTAVARDIKHQDKRVELERQGGDIMAMAA